MFGWFKKKPAPPSAGTNAVLAPTPTNPTHLVIGDLDNPLVEISRHDSTDTDQHEAVSIPESLAIGLRGLFQLAPSLLAANAVSGQYILRFAPEVAQSLANGTASLMPSLQGGFLAIARDSSGKILGHGTLVATNPAIVVALPLLAWQTLAFITAQRYLADITARLANLERGVQDIINWLETEQEAKLRAHYSYLRSLAERLPECHFQPAEVNAFANKLEDVEHDGLQVMYQLRCQREKCVKEIENQGLTASLINPGITLDRNEAELKEKLAKYHKINAKYLLAAQVRGMAAQLRCSLLLNSELSKDRLQKLSEELAELRTEVVGFHNKINSRLPELRSRYRSGTTDKEAQERVSKYLSEVTDTLGEHAVAQERLSRQMVQRVSQHKHELAGPVRLVATVNHLGEVVAIQRLQKRAPTE